MHYACWTPADWSPPTTEGTHDNWRIDPARAGGGAFIDLAPHGLDLVQVLLGEPLVETKCLLQRRVFDYPVDDGAALIGRFQSGALLMMNVAYNCPDHFPRRTLELIGTRAMAIALDTMGQTPNGSLRLVDAASGTTELVEVPPGEDISPFAVGIETFSCCLRSGESFPYSPEHDLHTMRLLAAKLISLFDFAVSLSPYVCTNCGFWQRHFTVPVDCPVCLDFRHTPAENGFEFWSEAEAAKRIVTIWREDNNGVWIFRSEPALGIGPSGYLIPLPGGNLLFEHPAWYSSAALDSWRRALVGGLASACLWRLVAGAGTLSAGNSRHPERGFALDQRFSSEPSIRRTAGIRTGR